MNIILDNLDEVSKAKYIEFKDKVQETLTKYQQLYIEKYELIRKKIEQTNGDWDTSINLVSNNTTEKIDISQLLAFEYCLATEKITQGKIKFEDMAEKLFDGTQKFRIGNPQKGIDDECLYGKSYNDETAIPVTSNFYRMVMSAGAQHLNYYKDGKLTGAVFIYEKGKLDGIAVDDNGNPISIKTDGINFSDLRKGQSLLNNLRQTAFHEWNHCAEQERFVLSESTLPQEYDCENGKRYVNYNVVNECVTFENSSGYQEPTIVISSQKDERGKNKRYFIDKDGVKKSLDNYPRWNLEKKSLDNPICVSIGLTTRDKADGSVHNMITEGFVEYTARTMVRAVDETADIDEGKYYEMVEMAKKVVEARDSSLEENGAGQTFSDFLMHSTKLKADLESRSVIKDDGTRTDGLHYIADYADLAHSQVKDTKKLRFFRDENMASICEKLGLEAKGVREKLEPLNLMSISQLTDDVKDVLRNTMMSGESLDEVFVEKIIGEISELIDGEREFFDGIAEKLGYVERNIQSPAIKSVPKDTYGQEQRDTYAREHSSTRLEKLENEQQLLTKAFEIRCEQVEEQTRGKDAYEKSE